MKPQKASSPLALVIGMGSLLLTAAAHAQVYRSVGADGRVIYSDTPQPAAASAPARGAARTESSRDAALPFSLRQTAQRYPVTLYTSASCDPCASGRDLLTRRGIPFTEKTVASNADIAALQKLAGGTDLPLLTIGAQQVKGYSDREWAQYLDAAGYPKTSQLPAGWQRPAAAPLAGPEPTQPAPTTAGGAPKAAAAPAADAEPQVAPARSSTNPAGIRF